MDILPLILFGLLNGSGGSIPPDILLTIENKQDKKDVGLNTESKFVVGAINEILSMKNKLGYDEIGVVDVVNEIKDSTVKPGRYRPKSVDIQWGDLPIGCNPIFVVRYEQIFGDIKSVVVEDLYGKTWRCSQLNNPIGDSGESWTEWEMEGYNALNFKQDKVDLRLTFTESKNLVDAVNLLYTNQLNKAPLVNGKVPSSYLPTPEELPTKLSEFINDTNFITNAVTNLVNYYTKMEVDGKLSSVYKWKGHVETVADLNNIVDPQNGDTYNITETGDNYAYLESEGIWDRLSGLVDLSMYATISALSTLEEVVNGKQSSTDNRLNTVSKSIIGAINELLVLKLPSGSLPVEVTDALYIWNNSFNNGRMKQVDLGICSSECVIVLGEAESIQNFYSGVFYGRCPGISRKAEVQIPFNIGIESDISTIGMSVYNLDYTMLSTFKPCIFKYNDKKYFGIVYKYDQNESSEFNFLSGVSFSDFKPFKIPMDDSISEFTTFIIKPRLVGEIVDSMIQDESAKNEGSLYTRQYFSDLYVCKKTYTPQVDKPWLTYFTDEYFEKVSLSSMYNVMKTKQDAESPNLLTEDKSVVGSINELKERIDNGSSSSGSGGVPDYTKPVQVTYNYELTKSFTCPDDGFLLLSIRSEQDAEVLINDINIVEMNSAPISFLYPVKKFEVVTWKGITNSSGSNITFYKNRTWERSTKF